MKTLRISCVFYFVPVCRILIFNSHICRTVSSKRDSNVLYSLQSLSLYRKAPSEMTIDTVRTVAHWSRFSVHSLLGICTIAQGHYNLCHGTFCNMMIMRIGPIQAIHVSRWCPLMRRYCSLSSVTSSLSSINILIQITKCTSKHILYKLMFQNNSRIWLSTPHINLLSSEAVISAYYHHCAVDTFIPIRINCTALQRVRVPISTGMPTRLSFSWFFSVIPEESRKMRCNK